MANNPYTSPQELKFTKRWARKSAADITETFPTYESNEDKVRADLQQLFDEIVSYLVDETNSKGYAAFIKANVEALQDNIDDITWLQLSGLVPDGSLSARHIQPALRAALSPQTREVVLESQALLDAREQTLEIDGLTKWSVVTLYPKQTDHIAALQMAGLTFGGFYTEGDTVKGIKIKANGQIPDNDITVVLHIDNSVNAVDVKYTQLGDRPEDAPTDWQTTYFLYYIKGEDEGTYKPIPKEEGTYPAFVDPNKQTQPESQENTESNDSAESSAEEPLNDLTGGETAPEPTEGLYRGPYYKIESVTPSVENWCPFINAVGDYVDPDVLQAGGIKEYIETNVTTAINDLLGESL